MFNIFKLSAARSVFGALALLSFIGCSDSPDDAMIRKNISDILASNKNYTDVRPIVEKGTVTLQGTCYGEGCVADVEKNVSGIDGVKKVVNELAVSSTDLTLRTSAQSIISRYAGVQADIAAGEIVLRGSISRDLLEPLMTELKALDARKIDNQLAIK